MFSKSPNAFAICVFISKMFQCINVRKGKKRKRICLIKHVVPWKWSFVLVYVWWVRVISNSMNIQWAYTHDTGHILWAHQHTAPDHCRFLFIRHYHCVHVDDKFNGNAFILHVLPRWLQKMMCAKMITFQIHAPGSIIINLPINIITYCLSFSCANAIVSVLSFDLETL